ncbi:tRNA (adenosine(37)-N6)-threonylcarbamoyltransferase complex dimerization subunit type 1 TsaB [Cyclobacterium plantarum]|uniref:tRNA (Adenosine(37)-N6)-threonylcarbamoyltransferase complex dimerization subunit type 1 TsaB n=1 Tax=Cyclobacterium plantarum TaxID=2716263 RepID=A0ABX0HCI1_9BACT|nr:tRNA (adenosine(37)-N6)-threonylcarbamoyltransferase complex dimerization subunit type 1 TsaB [Cyclobacterium plantarum]NHE59488.1 tRNA (adenosine(37)-N6)-threonylcarbamoyltransferase complex dimerization subunit type 1 TsaB [Cyclobacterium plantarum]
MCKILSIETSIAVCSIAIHDNGQLLALMELFQDNVHGSKLVPSIKSLMDQSGLGLKDLGAIAVSQGPGSYTGLRIGVATAKGLAFAHDLPLIAVDSLDALGRQLAHQVEENSCIVPMIDARRMEVYRKILDHTGETLVDLQPEVLDEHAFQEYLSRSKVYFLGNANAKTRSVISSSNAVFVDKLNSASSVGEIAFQKYKLGLSADIAYFEPNYLKEFMVLKSKKNPLLS